MASSPGAGPRASAPGWAQLHLQASEQKVPPAAWGHSALPPGLWKEMSEPQKIRNSFLKKKKKDLKSELNPNVNFN